MIGARAGGIPDNIRDGDTGFLHEVGDSEAIIEKVWTAQNPTCRAYANYWIITQVIDSRLVGEVSRGEKMALRGTDPESYIIEYILVCEEENAKDCKFVASLPG